MQLYTTYAELGEVSPERAWSAIRALRSDPPGLASRGDRRKVFASALEQSEQLFQAATVVGVETRPLLAFYGLSQAGRAITATLTDAGDWRLSGHGIKSGKTPSRRLADLTVIPGSGGSFGGVRDALKSSSIANPTRLGDLWPLLTETQRHPLPGSGGNRSLSISIDRTGWATGIPTVRVQGLPESFIAVGTGDVELMSGVGADYSAQADALNRYLAQYPSLSEREPIVSAGQPVGLQPWGDGTCSVNFRWPQATLQRYPSIDQLGRSLGVMSSGAWRVYPALDGSSRPVHPMTVWWAILFRLSMLARYEPEAWEGMTDVNASADAVPIEHLLRAALSAVPALIYDALTSYPDTR